MYYDVPFPISLALLCLLFTFPTSLAQAPAQPPDNEDWTGWGSSIYNTRWAPENAVINSTTVPKLQKHCQIEYPVGVSANPVTVNGTAYYPTWNGSFVALDYAACTVKWQISVTDIITGFAPLTDVQKNTTLPVSRTSPQIYGNVLYFGTQSNALLVAVNLNTGALLGTIQVNPHPMAIITVSPTIYDGKIFVGTSSQEEVGAKLPGYQCCSFIGNMAAFTFDGKQFKNIWEVSTLPANAGWSGAGVWGSQPSIDPVRNQVFFSTGNLYNYPAEYQHCATQSSACMPANVNMESVLALDTNTGNVNWIQRVSPLDAFTMACYDPNPSPLCSVVSPAADADFSIAPTFVPASLSGTSADMVVVGQKSGNLYAFAAKDGTGVWTSATSPSSDWGGLSWGIAVDAKQIYFTAINYGGKSWNIQPSNTAITNSAWGAANLATGAINWEVQVPQNEFAYTPPTVVGDVVLVARSGGTGVTGALMALSTKNGQSLYEFPTDSTVRGGITVQDQFIIFGSGYDYSTEFKSGSLYVLVGPVAVAKGDAQSPLNPITTTIGGIVATITPKPKKNAASSPVHFDLFLFIIPLVAFIYNV
jgi:outer membrane protein assembly factor BamB